MKKRVYIFLRKDLDLVQQTVQASHAALDVGRKFNLPDERYRIVILGVRSEVKLKAVIQELHLNNIAHISYLEPDINALTAIATEPLDDTKGQLLSRYRLLDEPIKVESVESSRIPGSATVAAAKAEMQRENQEREAYYQRPEIVAQGEENNRRSNLPSEHPDHICGIRCDGQDGQTSDCWRLREKLGFHR